MQDDMEKLVHVKFKGIMDDMLVKIEPGLYIILTVMEWVKLVIYTALSKELYRILHPSLFYWQKLTTMFFNGCTKSTPTTGMWLIKPSREFNV